MTISAVRNHTVWNLNAHYIKQFYHLEFKKLEFWSYDFSYCPKIKICRHCNMVVQGLLNMVVV